MELMGNWDPGVIGSLTPDQKPLPDLGWFPFPAVAGGQGDPTAIMGGSDGYSLSKNAPKEAFEFLEFLVTKDQQEAYAKAFDAIPVNQAAQDAVTDPYNVSALQAFNKAAYSMQYLDTAVRPERRQRHEHRRGEPDGRQGQRRRHRLGHQQRRRERLSTQTMSDTLGTDTAAGRQSQGTAGVGDAAAAAPGSAASGRAAAAAVAGCDWRSRSCPDRRSSCSWRS